MDARVILMISTIYGYAISRLYAYGVMIPSMARSLSRRRRRDSANVAARDASSIERWELVQGWYFTRRSEHEDITNW
jgi:hypothetical protein